MEQRLERENAQVRQHHLRAKPLIIPQASSPRLLSPSSLFPLSLFHTIKTLTPSSTPERATCLPSPFSFFPASSSLSKTTPHQKPRETLNTKHYHHSSSHLSIEEREREAKRIVKMKAIRFELVLLFMLLCSFDASLAILEPVDYLALQSIRKSLSDLAGSRFFVGWDFTGDPCAFPGVFCSGNRVAALALGDPRAGSPGLAGRLSPDIGRLSALTELSLVPGRVVGPIPTSLSLCRSLRFLALSRNFLSGTVPPSLAALRRLRTLDLSFNILSGNIPLAIAGIPDLSNLILCHNRLSGQIPPFPLSSPLLRLDLKQNYLSGEIPALPASLRYLSLSSNSLSGPVDRVLPRLARLNYLDLSMNRLSGQIPGQIFSFPISSLQLQRNDFSGPVWSVDQLPAGATVDLSYNQLTGPVPAALAAAGRLYLNNNRFSGEVPATFVERVVAGKINVLYLQHNYLTAFGISPAATIPASTSLCLQYNCMVPPVETPCPVKAGPQKTRPAAQCGWRKG